jgi:hypothetical protein
MGFCRVLVEFEQNRVCLYLCNRSGKVVDEEVFVLPKADDRIEAEIRARLVHAGVYDTLNYSINGAGSTDPGKQK